MNPATIVPVVFAITPAKSVNGESFTEFVGLKHSGEKAIRGWNEARPRNSRDSSQDKE